MNWNFDFEKMDVYKLALEVARWIRTVPWPDGSAKTRDQGVRAAESVVLNFAEGWLRPGKAGKNQIRIAFASAGEVVAVLDVVTLPDGLEMQRKMRRVGAMLAKLAR